MRSIEEIKNYFGSNFKHNYEAFAAHRSREKWTKLMAELGNISHLPGFELDFKIKAEATDHYYSIFMHHPEMIQAPMKMGLRLMKPMFYSMLVDPRLVDEYQETRKTLNEFIRFVDTL